MSEANETLGKDPDSVRSLKASNNAALFDPFRVGNLCEHTWGVTRFAHSTLGFNVRRLWRQERLLQCWSISIPPPHHTKKPTDSKSSVGPSSKLRCGYSSFFCTSLSPSAFIKICCISKEFGRPMRVAGLRPNAPPSVFAAIVMRSP